MLGANDGNPVDQRSRRRQAGRGGDFRHARAARVAYALSRRWGWPWGGRRRLATRGPARKRDESALTGCGRGAKHKGLLWVTVIISLGLGVGKCIDPPGLRCRSATRP